MGTTIKATYERGVLKLEEPISLPDGAEVHVVVISNEEGNGERSQGMDNHSWDALTQLLTECAVDTGIPDLASEHDHYLYGISKRVTDADSTR